MKGSEEVQAARTILSAETLPVAPTASIYGVRSTKGYEQAAEDSFDYQISRALYKGTASAGPIKSINPPSGFSPCNG
jgi:hypothetical protein